MGEKLTGKLADLQAKFKKKVFDRKNTDPHDEFYWDSIAFGHALAHGFSRKDAYRFSMDWMDDSGSLD